MSSPIVSSLIALAVGDCLGAPVENWSRERIASRFPGGLRDFQWPAPIWTDDTQQALVLVESTLRHGTPDPAWIAERFAAMSWPREGGRFGCHRGTGRGFRAAVTAFERSRDWRASGRPDRAGNGAAMRIAPIAVALSWRGEAAQGTASPPAFRAALDDDAFASAMIDASLVTHHESRALAGALAVARLAAQLGLAGAFPLPRPRAREQLADLASWLRERESWLAQAYPQTAPFEGGRHDVSDLLARLVARLDEGWAACEREIVMQSSERLARPTRASEGYVLCSVVSAIALVLLADDSLEETLIRAVGLGGDADTTAAMVGGMAGAAAGAAAIPERWLCMAGHDALRAWGEALAASALELRGGEGHSARAGANVLPDLLALERCLSETLRASRATNASSLR